METRPGDEGKNEIVLTVSDFDVEDPHDKPASSQPQVEKDKSAQNQNKTPGRYFWG